MQFVQVWCLDPCIAFADPRILLLNCQMARFDPAAATVATAVNMSPGLVPGNNRLEHNICGKASQVLGHDPLIVMYLRDSLA